MTADQPCVGGREGETYDMVFTEGMERGETGGEGESKGGDECSGGRVLVPCAQGNRKVSILFVFKASPPSSFHHISPRIVCLPFALRKPFGSSRCYVFIYLFPPPFTSHLNSGKLQDLGVVEGSKLTLVPTVEAGLMVNEFFSPLKFSPPHTYFPKRGV